MPDIYELITYAFINYIPYMVLALIPFKTTLRFSSTKTNLIFIVFSIIEICLFIHGFYLGEPYHTLSTYFITLLSISFYFISVKARWGRMLFNLFMIKNIANFIVIVSKCLEGKIFPHTIYTMYHWTNTLCMLIIMVIIAPAIISIVNTYFTKKIRDAINPSIWCYLWLVPLFFYGIWLYIFYYSSSESSLQLAIKPVSTIFMLIFLSGQLLIYICIAKFVIQHNKASLLEEENFRLSEQYLQYHSIQDRIQEISKYKHDMRHQLITINNYVDRGEYDELKKYLNNYATAEFWNDKILYCGNVTLNMLLVYYAQKCKHENIQFNVELNIPNNILLSASDITVLFGNLIENAVDACTAITNESERFITLTGKVFQNRLIFIIENLFCNSFTTETDGAIYSTKHSGYGIGTASAKDIVAKYKGTIYFSPDNNVFSVSIFIPLS